MESCIEQSKALSDDLGGEPSFVVQLGESVGDELKL